MTLDFSVHKINNKNSSIKQLFLFVSTFIRFTHIFSFGYMKADYSQNGNFFQKWDFIKPQNPANAGFCSQNHEKMFSAVNVAPQSSSKSPLCLKQAAGNTHRWAG